MSDRKRIGRILVFFGVGFILNFLIRNGLADIINLFLKEGRIPNVSLSLYYLIKISVGIIMTGIGIYMLRKDKKRKLWLKWLSKTNEKNQKNGFIIITT